MHVCRGLLQQQQNRERNKCIKSNHRPAQINNNRRDETNFKSSKISVCQI